MRFAERTRVHVRPGSEFDPLWLKDKSFRKLNFVRVGRVNWGNYLDCVISSRVPGCNLSSDYFRSTHVVVTKRKSVPFDIDFLSCPKVIG